MQTKRETRGGKREGAGAKKRLLSMTQVAAALDTAERYAKKEGKNVDEILLDFIYGKVDKQTVKEQLAAIKIWKDKTMIQLAEGGESDQALAPEVYLPSERPDPAKIVPIKAG